MKKSRHHEKHESRKEERREHGHAGYHDYHREHSASDRGIRHTAEHHGSDMPDFGIGHITHNAMTKDWSQGGYALEQDGDGSMNYLSEKDTIHAKDETRIRRHKAKIGDAV